MQRDVKDLEFRDNETAIAELFGVSYTAIAKQYGLVKYAPNEQVFFAKKLADAFSYHLERVLDERTPSEMALSLIAPSMAQKNKYQRAWERTKNAADGWQGLVAIVENDKLQTLASASPVRYHEPGFYRIPKASAFHSAM